MLAGGSGTRFWPLSWKSYPKQFSKLTRELTLFQQSALPLTSSDTVKFRPHVTMTNSDFRFIVGKQLQSVGIHPGSIFIEPERKNTAPDVLAASLDAFEQETLTKMLITFFVEIILTRRSGITAD